MSRNEITLKGRRAVFVLGTAASAACTAALFSLGTAATASADDSWSWLLGDTAVAAAATPPGTLDPPPPIDPPAGSAPYDTDGYQILFGSTDNASIPALQGEDNANLGMQLLARDPGLFTSFDESAAAFQANAEHPISLLINLLDPNAYVDQITAGIGGVDGAVEGAYLVPTDFFGYLGTFTDYFLLQPTGLGFLLDPVGEILLGNPPF